MKTFIFDNVAVSTGVRKTNMQNIAVCRCRALFPSILRWPTEVDNRDSSHTKQTAVSMVDKQMANLVFYELRVNSVSIDKQ